MAGLMGFGRTHGHDWIRGAQRRSRPLLAVGLSRFKPAALEDAPTDEVEEETVELRFFVPAVPGGWAGSLARLARPVGASSLSTGLAQPRFKRVKWVKWPELFVEAGPLQAGLVDALFPRKILSS